MIYTCTLNPSIDYIVELDSIRLGDLNRAKRTEQYPGGKGINVSRVLKRLGVENTALGFIGGFTGEFIREELSKELVNHDFVKANGTTRINVKLKSGDETEINGQGPTIEIEQINELLQKVEAMNEGDIFVLAGSLPSSVPADFYKTLAAAARARGVKIVADTSGPALQEIIEEKLFLIKPNHHELGELFETTITSKEESIAYAKRLVESGIQNVIVSMAGAGALLITNHKILYANAPKGTVKNSVGAGDSTIGGFLAAYTKGKALEECFRYGVASGSATAFSSDLCTKEEVEKLLPEITITQV
ncbi:1-phosphofructokinase [Ectobacillus funiculus]|uniref:1-phosphofructokinase n=1 Tax=Ectobacillus funiculus TaxID=137993 RepID=UPI00101DF3FF|nr:1-phosphofructokinase [Ectobacillus funiculus]